MQADIQVLDPLVNMAGSGSRVAHMVFDTLFALDHDLVPQPQMVGSTDVSADGLTYTFVLRPGLRFHDGAPVTADDVVASLMRWWVKDGGGQILHKFTREFTPVDARTIRLVLNQPYGLVLDTLAKPVTNVPVIMPKRLAQTDPNQAVSEIIGSGPFRFVKDEWVPGSKVVFAKNTDYVPSRTPERLRRRQGGKSRSRRMGFAAGSADCGAGVEPRRGRFHGAAADRSAAVAESQQGGNHRNPGAAGTCPAAEPFAAAIRRCAGASCHAVAGRPAIL